MKQSIEERKEWLLQYGVTFPEEWSHFCGPLGSDVMTGIAMHPLYGSVRFAEPIQIDHERTRLRMSTLVYRTEVSHDYGLTWQHVPFQESQPAPEEPAK